MSATTTTYEAIVAIGGCNTPFSAFPAHHSFSYVTPNRLVHLVVSHSPSSLPDAPVGSVDVACRQGYEFTTSRGGLLLHTPSEDMDRFPHFVQPLMMSLEDPAPPHDTDNAWKQHMIQLHNREAPKKRSRAPRSGVKRKQVQDEEELVWSLESMLQSQHEEKQRHRSAVIGEDDACTLEYLHLRHSGNVEAAELNLLVDLSSGRGKECKFVRYSRIKRIKLTDPFRNNLSQHQKYGNAPRGNV
jgi:hypothetical protein